MEAAALAPPLTVHLPEGAYRHIQYKPDLSFQERVLDLGGGLKLRAVLYGNDLYLGGLDCFPWNTWGTPVPLEGNLPVTIQVAGSAHTKVVTREYQWNRPSTGWGGSSYSNYRREQVTQEDCYLPTSDHRYDGQHDPKDPARRPYLYLDLDITLPDGHVRRVEVKFRVPPTGVVTIEKDKLHVQVEALGFKYQFVEDFSAPRDNQGGYAYVHAENSPLAVLRRHLEGSTIVGGPAALWTAFLDQWHDDTKTPMDGLAAAYKNKGIAPNLARLQKEEPLDWAFFRWLHDASTSDGKRNNQLLSTMLLTVGSNYDLLLEGLRAARGQVLTAPLEWASYRDPSKSQGFPVKRALCLTLPGVAEKVQEIEAQKDFRKAKGNAAQAEGLGVTESKFPKLRAAIEAGDIPIAVFNQPKDRGTDGQPVNREFPLWERALTMKGWSETIFKIAANAATRSTYERDITPYLMALFQVPKYLDKHAPRPKGQSWVGQPKFVESQWELEMDDDANENGTQKRRSAFTPVADNEKGVIEIPYVAVRVTGVRTQWCYARHYYIFEEGFTDPESGGMVLRDLEPKLNGRDDYGLMYYTLTGTDTARGYPTFLIIFEKRASTKSPFVHFHRVRPCRSKDGVKTPACNLIEACYQYMAGNIPAADITAQQGDLIFLKMDHDPLAAKAKVEPDSQTSPVLVFESHALQSLNPDVALTLHRSAAKTPQNRLGFVWAPTGLKVGHPEHDDIENLPEGWYEIRRCKSWEANPKAIWSLTID